MSQAHYNKAIAILLLALAGALVYAPGMQHPFVWDDEVLIVGNPLIKSLERIPDIFTSSFWAGSGSYYRPLAILTYALDYRFWGLNPFGYHLTDLLIHLTGVILIFFLLIKHFHVRTAFGAALIWCVHPVCSSIVLPVFGRAGMLEVFLFAALLCLQHAARNRFAGAACILFFAASLSAKESAMIFPIVASAYAFCFFSREEFKKTAWLFLLMSAILAVYVSARFAWLPFRVSNPLSVISNVTTPWRLWTFAGVPLRYLLLWIFPIHLHNERLFTTLNLADPLTLTSIIFWSSALTWAYRRRKKSPHYLFGMLWFLIGLAPTSHLIRVPITMAEHWIYIPSLGFVWILAFWMNKLTQNPKKIAIFYLSLALAANLLAFRTAVRLKDWRSPISLYTADVQHSPNSFLLHNNLAVELFRKGDFANAEKEFLEANRIEPRYGTTTNNLGVIAMKKGDAKKAEHYYRLSIHQSNYFLAYLNLGEILIRQGKKQEARTLLKQGLKVHPYNEKIRTMLGWVENPGTQEAL